MVWLWKVWIGPENSSTTYTRVMWQSTAFMDEKQSRSVRCSKYTLESNEQAFPCSTPWNKYSQRKFHASVKTLDSRYTSWKHVTQVEVPEIHRIYRKAKIFVKNIVVGTINVLFWDMRFWLYRTATHTHTHDNCQCANTVVCLQWVGLTFRHASIPQPVTAGSKSEVRTRNGKTFGPRAPKRRLHTGSLMTSSCFLSALFL